MAYKTKAADSVRRTENEAAACRAETTEQEIARLAEKFPRDYAIFKLTIATSIGIRDALRGLERSA